MNDTELIHRAGELLSRRRFLTGAALTASGLAVASLWPESARAGIIPVPSPSEQKKVGNQAAQQVLKQYKVVSDSRAKHFEEMGRKLVGALSAEEQKTWDY